MYCFRKKTTYIIILYLYTYTDISFSYGDKHNKIYLLSQNIGTELIHLHLLAVLRGGKIPLFLCTYCFKKNYKCTAFKLEFEIIKINSLLLLDNK